MSDAGANQLAGAYSKSHALGRLGGILAAALLAGCSSMPSMNPADWWHSLRGGEVAEQRPPPPNADAPYPNVGTVPARPPVTPDAATRSRIASALVADRANAQYVGVAAPDPSKPSTAPQAFGVGTAPPPAPPAAPGAPSASLQAATAPPAAAATPPPVPSGPPTPPRPAPLGKVAATPLAAPQATASAAPATDAGALNVPASPPPAPNIPGVGVPATTAPTPAPVAPPPKPAPPPAAAATPGAVLVEFPLDSAEMQPAAQDALRTLARIRGGAALQAIGYGDAPAGDPAAQSAALPLALSRARAIAAVLTAAGVPSSQVRLEAEAEGHGGVARIAN
jgi:outer membrane protein OmpA-like peptidoglycan-associated protein